MGCCGVRVALLGVVYVGLAPGTARLLNKQLGGLRLAAHVRSSASITVSAPGSPVGAPLPGGRRSLLALHRRRCCRVGDEGVHGTTALTHSCAGFVKRAHCTIHSAAEEAQRASQG